METLFAWIQLSDIHVGHGGAAHVEDQRLVLDALRADVARLLAAGTVPRPDAIFVTGDIAFSGNVVSQAEYSRAAEWLRAIGAAANLGPESVFVVPGNHDVQRTADKVRNVERLLKTLRGGGEELDSALRHGEDHALLAQRFANFLAFAKDFAPACRPDAEKAGPQLYWRHQLPARSGLKVRLGGLNSALLAADEKVYQSDRGLLRLGRAQLADVLLAPSIEEGEAVILLTHHPFREGWLADQRYADEWSRGHTHIHLSGHVHEADSEEARTGSGGSFARVTAGAAHSEREPEGVPARHGYNFAAIVAVNGQAKLRVWPRQWSERNREFRRDGDNLPEGRDFAEHDLPRLRVPGAPPPDDGPKGGSSDKPVPPSDPTPPNLERLAFRPEAQTSDYYDGKHARPGHILEGLDVRRPRWLEAIDKTFEQYGCCVIRASSGQGKSSLLYRYAFEHSTTATVLRLHRCSTDAEVDTTVAYIRELSASALVLVDNLSYGTRLWGEVAARLAGSGVRFLVSSREEDWYRYAPALSGVSLGFVAPILEADEARRIFDELKARGRARPEVPSPEWAYERVAARRLLIEFVYLVTHGRMLRERLVDQIREMRARGEDRAKLDVLRLVAVAQVYGARVPLDGLERTVTFEDDASGVFQSLQNEYLVIEQGCAEGLHLIRSEHLASLLHEPHPTREATVARLIGILDRENILPFMGSVIADRSLSYESYMQALTDRCKHEPSKLLTSLTETVFTACEQRYIDLHRKVYEDGIREDGMPSLFFLVSASLPIGPQDLLSGLPIADERKHLLRALITRFKDRYACGSHAPFRMYCSQALGGLAAADYPLGDIATLSYWSRHAKVRIAWIDGLMTYGAWEESLLGSDRETIGAFLWEISLQTPARLSTFLGKHRSRLLELYQDMYEVVSVAENGNEIEVHFVPDALMHYKTWASQAEARLRALRKWFPTFTAYRSRGVFSPETAAVLPWRDTDKDFSVSTLEMLLEHAPRNRIYVDLVDEAFAADAIDEWVRQWLAFRRDALIAVDCLRDAYATTYRREPVRELDVIRAAVVRMYGSELPKLSRRWKGAYPECQRAIDEFSSSLSNVFGNAGPLLLEGEDGRPPDRRSLVQMNAFNVVRRLDAMQREFAAIARPFVSDASLRDLGDEERRVYRCFLEFAEFDQARRGEITPDLPGAIKAWRRESAASYRDQVRKALQPLSDLGVKLYLPSRPLREEFGTSLVVGFEVLRFESSIIEQQIGAVAGLCLQAGIEFAFLYVVACVERQRAIRQVLRISRTTLEELNAGKRPAIAFIPQDDPIDLAEVLAEISKEGPPEFQWLWAFQPLFEQIATLRQGYDLLVARLQERAASSPLPERRQRLMGQTMEEIGERYQQLSERGRELLATSQRPALWAKVLEAVEAPFQLVRRTHVVDLPWSEFLTLLGAIDQALWSYANDRYGRA